MFCCMDWRGKAAGGGKEAPQPVNEVSRAGRGEAELAVALAM